MKSGTTTIIDRLPQVADGIKNLSVTRVLVGVPADRGTRTDAMNNAALLYIHDHGAPEANIPARPSMRPGIQKGASQINAGLKEAAQAALDGKSAERGFARAGTAGRDGIKEVIGSNIPPPLSPKTIANRYRQRGTKSRRAGEKQYLEMVGKGVPRAQAQSAAGIVALINTGAMRNAVNYVIRKGDKT